LTDLFWERRLMLLILMFWRMRAVWNEFPFRTFLQTRMTVGIRNWVRGYAHGPFRSFQYPHYTWPGCSLNWAE
jgi:hypothetical protein